jgi:hypothetical protein
MYYNDGDWFSYSEGAQVGDFGSRFNPYSRDSVSFPTGYPAENWRMVEHNGRWWYWSPQESWLYFNDNSWNAYQAQSTALQQQRMGDRYRTGYRGDVTPGNGSIDVPLNGQGVAPSNAYSRSPHAQAVDPNLGSGRPLNSQRQGFEAQGRTESMPGRSFTEATPGTGAQLTRPQSTARPQGMAPPTQQPQAPSGNVPSNRAISPGGTSPTGTTPPSGGAPSGGTTAPSGTAPPATSP